MNIVKITCIETCYNGVNVAFLPSSNRILSNRLCWRNEFQRILMANLGAELIDFWPDWMEWKKKKPKNDS